MESMGPPVKLTSFDDVVSQILPLAPSMTERDIADLLQAVAADPSAADVLEADYRAANASLGVNVLDTIWAILLEASQVAGIISSLAGVVALA